MPAATETVISKPLSGSEVRQIIINKLTNALAGDTRLAEYIAIPAFRFRLDIAILLNGAIHPNVDYAGDTGSIQGGSGELVEAEAHAVTHHIDQQEMAPNEARIDGDIGVPVLGHDEKGRPVEKTVKYGKEQVRRAKGE